MDLICLVSFRFVFKFSQYNLPSSSGIPSLSSNEVAIVASPNDLVFSPTFVGVSDVTGTVGPEGVVKSSVGTSAAGSAGTTQESSGVGSGSS